MCRMNETSPLNFTMACTVAGPLSRENLLFALDEIQRRHPLLRVQIEKLGNKYRFTPTQSRIPLEKLEATDADLVTVMQRQINTPFHQEQGPLVRCIWFEEEGGVHHVLLTVHHVIGDGMSGMQLLRDLLTVAGSNSNRNAYTLEALDNHLAMDHRLPPSARNWAGFVNAAKFSALNIFQDIRLGAPDLWTIKGEVSIGNRETIIAFKEFSEDFTDALADRARKEQSTVHAALSAAICLSFAEEFDDKRMVSVKHRSPVNIRKDLEPPADEEVGMFASLAFFRARINQHDDFWTTARSVREQIENQVRRSVPVVAATVPCRLYRFFRCDRLDNRKMADIWWRYAKSSTGLTNLGRVDLPTHFGDLTVKELHTAVSPGIIGDYTSTVTTFNNRLTLSFMMPAKVFPAARRNRFVDNVERRLTAALSDSRSSAL